MTALVPRAASASRGAAAAGAADSSWRRLGGCRRRDRAVAIALRTVVGLNGPALMLGGLTQIGRADAGAKERGMGRFAARVGAQTTWGGADSRSGAGGDALALPNPRCVRPPGRPVCCRTAGGSAMANRSSAAVRTTRRSIAPPAAPGLRDASRVLQDQSPREVDAARRGDFAFGLRHQSCSVWWFDTPCPLDVAHLGPELRPRCCPDWQSSWWGCRCRRRPRFCSRPRFRRRSPAAGDDRRGAAGGRRRRLLFDLARFAEPAAPCG